MERTNTRSNTESNTTSALYVDPPIMPSALEDDALLRTHHAPYATNAASCLCYKIQTGIRGAECKVIHILFAVFIVHTPDVHALADAFFSNTTNLHLEILTTDDSLSVCNKKTKRICQCCLKHRPRGGSGCSSRRRPM